MKKILGVSTAVLMIFGAVTAASAAQLQIIGGVERSIPGNFNPGGNPAPSAISRINSFINVGVPGNPFEVDSSTGVEVASFTGFGKTASNGLAIDFQGASAVDITFTYFGKEAGFTNLALSMDGGVTQLFHNKQSALGDSETIRFFNPGANAGTFFLPFIFETNKGNSNTSNDVQIANDGIVTKVDSGAHVDDLELGFLRQLNNDLFANTLGIAQGSTVAFFGDGTGDTDLDDMVIGIGITGVVPLPAPALLLLTALGGLGLVSRMKRRLA